MSGTLFFDGNCGMCTRSRNFLLKLNRTGGLLTEPLQTPGTAGRTGDDAALDADHWTGHSGCVILAPQLMTLTKKELGLPPVSKATERQKKEGMC